MSAEQRRGQARAAARALLADGTTVDQLALRSVADQAGIPLSTLTYSYGSVGDLLTDLRSEFEQQVAADQLRVGAGGLVVELNRMMAGYLDLIAADPSNVEILRWQMLLIARGEIVTSGGLSMRGCLRRIQDASGEQWALPLAELSMLTQAMISGGHVQFFVRGADDVALAAWRQDAEQFVEALGRLALPYAAG
jgi:AcrR family transcriptional regulator